MENKVFLVELSYTVRTQSETEFEALDRVASSLRFCGLDVSGLTAKVVPAPQPPGPTEVHFPDAETGLPPASVSDADLSSGLPF